MTDGMTNAEMKDNSAKHLAHLDLQLAESLGKLRGLLAPDEQSALELLQMRWEEYRDAVAAFARLGFKGGTNAALAGATALINETERRVSAIDAEIKRRSRL